MAHNRRYTSWVAGLFAVMLVATACGSSGAASDEQAPIATSEEASEAGEQPANSRDERDVIRFAFAPDPVMDYMKDTGELAEWEEEHNIRIVTSESWEEYEYFAGGHGDVASVATAELPLLEEKMGTKLVAFGQYNHERAALLRRARDDFNSLADVPADSTICANSAVSNTIVWSVIADQLHDINYRVGEGQFQMELHDHFAMPQLVADRECVVAATIPEAAIGPLRAGDLEALYDGRAPWQIYQEDICECDHKGIMSNLFVATEQWFDANPEQAAAFLALWERGLQLWQENKANIIALYPTHFAVETEEDVEFMVEYMDDNDWFADTVYLDEAWIEEERRFYDYMIEAGWISEGTEPPNFEVVGSSS